MCATTFERYRARVLIQIAGIVAGLILLSYAADQFVVGAARLAVALRMSAIAIGAVVIGFGTSAPELLVSAIAASRGSVDIAVGNVVGSNLANMTLVLGTAALITPIATTSGVLKREAPLSVASVVVFAVLIQGTFGVLQGAVLALVLTGSLAIVLRSSRDDPSELPEQVEGWVATRTPDTRREIARTVISLLVTLGAAHLLIVSATGLASSMGISEGFVGVTIVAIGTSLPELATAIQAARRNQTDLLVGNLLGSNLFNAGAVGATIAFIGRAPVTDPMLVGPASLAMLGAVFLSFVFLVTGARVVRWEGLTLLALYAATLPMLAG
ncbi:MAG: calcium/sodium antiporter [Nitriliruptoraceae bacterium]